MNPVAGEVVFNTGMAGYIETLTDPSYRGQILVCTYPLIGSILQGNRACTTAFQPRGDPRKASTAPTSRARSKCRVSSCSTTSANTVTMPPFLCCLVQRSLGAWLEGEEVPAVTGIDTRTLTRRLREHGTMAGWLFPSEMELSRALQHGDGRLHRDPHGPFLPGAAKKPLA